MSASVAIPEFSSYDDFQDFAAAAGWSDGFPLVPPEPEQIDKALATLCIDPDQVVGEAPYRGVSVSARDVALHGVMAGCRPEYTPALTAAVQAFFDNIELRDWEPGGVSETAQCVIFNGPVRNALNINCGPGALGPGWRANATIGRALRLLIGSKFGARRAKYFGDSALYSFCFGEDEEKSPWMPLHVERGFAPEASTATVHSVNLYPKLLDRKSAAPEALLDEIVIFLRGRVGGADWFPGEHCSVLLLFGFEHQQIFGAAGWDKARLRDYLFPRLTIDDGRPFHRVRLARQQDLLIVAAGGQAFATVWAIISYRAKPGTRAIDIIARKPYG